jgi:pSer/pThr/pTyr-binding forkhead associated (FHA) protein
LSYDAKIMNESIEIFDITEPNAVVLGALNSDEVFIGRDPGTGITVPNQAVSRQHGIFLRFRDHIFYKDLGSTNGSWCNGVTLNAGQFKIVRPGDVLQLANTALRVGHEAASDSLPANRSLIVLTGNDFTDEIIIPDFGRALVIGGSQADLTVDGDTGELPALVIERKGDSLTAYALSRTTRAQLNGRILTDAILLRDGDEIKVGEYTVLINEPTSKRLAALGPEQALLQMPTSSLIKERPEISSGQLITQSSLSRDSRSTSGTLDWNKTLNESTETIAFDPKIAQKFKMQMGDRHPSTRSSASISRIPRPSPGSLEAWLALFTILCLVMAFGVFLYIVLFM